jgi:replicative DNA helicase
MTATEEIPLRDRTQSPPTDSSADSVAPPPLLSTTTLLSSVLADIAARHQTAQGGGWTGGLRCGIPLLDDELRGLRPKTVTIMNAEPNIGKTTLCNQIAYQIAAFPNQDAAALYVTFENAAEGLLLKQLSRLSGWTMNDLEAGKVPPADARLAGAAQRLASVPLFYLTGTSAATPEVLTARAKEAVQVAARSELLLVVDYLQYFARFFSGASLEQIGAALSSLRTMAQETGASLLVIGSQNRATNRGASEVTMFGGRGSGEIEYDADTVLSLTRVGEGSDKGSDNKRVKLTAVKTRFGGAGKDMELDFSPERAYFAETGAETPGAGGGNFGRGAGYGAKGRGR